MCNEEIFNFLQEFNLSATATEYELPDQPLTLPADKGFTAMRSLAKLTAVNKERV